jgi:hypothetical protein
MLFLTKCYFNPSGGSIEYFKKELKVKNPTVFIFDKSLDEIKKVIEKEFFHYTNDGCLYQKKNYTVYNKLFEDSSNFDDYILARFTAESKIYFKKPDSMSLIYDADFHLHLIKIDTCRTLVQIITYDNYIVIGEKTMGFVGEIGRAIVQSVEPTSIEEYEILLKIGEALGVKDKMPPLLLPE